MSRHEPDAQAQQYARARAGDAMTDIDLAALRAVAEDPFVAPSERVQARKQLRAYREQAEAAEGAAGAARRIRAKLAAGRDLTWREFVAARAMGLLKLRDDEDGA